MNKSIKYMFIIVLFLIEFTSLFLTFKSYVNKTIDEIENTNIIDDKTFAMYIENDSGEYDELLDSTLFPRDTHELNYELTTCIDNKGNSVDNSILVYSDGKVTATSNKTVFCYLYFEYLPKAYAIYSDTDNSLRFYKNKDSEGLEETYNNLSVTTIYSSFISDSYTSASSIPWSDNTSNIKSVVVEEEIHPTDMSYWFSELRNAEKLNLLKIDTSNVVSISYTFSHTGYNTNSFEMDVSNWDISQVTNMQGTFYYTGYKATEWNIGDLSNWQTGKATDFYRLFSRAGYSTETFNIGDISNWDTSKVTRMRSVFYEAGYKSAEWNVGDLSNWDTSNVTNMQTMFAYAASNASSTNLDLSGWDTSNVTNMSSMFLEFARFVTGEWSIGNLSNWNVSKVIDMSNMFWSTSQFSSTFDVGNLGSWDIRKVENMSGMFAGCGKDAKTWSIGNLSTWNTSNVTDMSNMFYFTCQSASTFDIGNLGNWDVSKVTNMSSMFGESALHAKVKFNIGNISNWDTSNVKSMSAMFNNFGLTVDYELNLSNWQVPLVTNYGNFNVGVESKVIAPTWVN